MVRKPFLALWVLWDWYIEGAENFVILMIFKFPEYLRCSLYLSVAQFLIPFWFLRITDMDSVSVKSTSTPPPPPPPPRKSLSAFDIFFVGLIVLALVAGVQLSKVRGRFSPFGVSVLFGSAISLLTYHFLGGINKDEATVKTSLGNSGNLVLGGSVAALVGTTLISNFVLEKQMREIDLSYQPSSQDLLVLDEDAELVDQLKILGVFGSVNEEKVIEISPELAEKVMEICNEGRGFCKREFQSVELNISRDLRQGIATICQGHEWNGYPLMVRSSESLEAIRVMAVADQFCFGNGRDEPHLINISEEDANLLKVSVDGSSGDAFILPLKQLSLPYIYKTDSE